MASAKIKSATAELLEHLYQNVKMGADSIRALLPRVESEDAKFKSDLTMQLGIYEDFAQRINTLLGEEDCEALSDRLMTKMSASLGAAMGTLLDQSVSHMADLVIRGATMGITDTTRTLREYEDTPASECALDLARDMIRAEQESIERMKAYL